MIGKPILKRRPVILSHNPEGGFDIPTFPVHYAMEYFAGRISLKEVQMKFFQNGDLVVLNYSEEQLIERLRKELIGNERFFTFLN